MYIQPFALLFASVLAWAIIPPTIFYAWNRISCRMQQKMGKKVRPTPEFVLRKWFFGYFFVAAAFGWSTVFLFVPLIKSIMYSLTDKTLSPTVPAQFVGAENYIKIMTDPMWWKGVAVTVIYILGTLPYSVFLCLFLAGLIVNLPPFWQTFFKTALYLPGVTGVAVGAAITRWVYYPGDGFANLILRKMGFIHSNIAWFGDKHFALPTLIVGTWLGVNAIGVIIYCAALGGIPKDYYEAADIDGATPTQKFLKITWPLVKPSTVYVTITGLIGGFQIFAPALLITGGGPEGTTNFVNYIIYRTFYYDNEFGRACAMSVVLMLVIIIISMINYKVMATDVEY